MKIPGQLSAEINKITAASIQLHGGIGFTWDYPAHLYLKRAVTDSGILGNADQQREVIAEQIIRRGTELVG